MNERDLAQRFTDLLEGRAEPGADTPAEVLEALETARRLSRAVSPAAVAQRERSERSERSETLRARLLARHTVTRRQAVWSGGFGLAARALALVVIVAGLGLLINQLLRGQLPLPAINPTATLTAPADVPDLAAGLDAAARQVRFNVLSFPAGEYTLASVELADGSLMQTFRSGSAVYRLSQSPATGDVPMKATGEVELRGTTGWWVTLNIGDTVLYWEEGGATNVLSRTDGGPTGGLADAAANLQVYSPARTLEEAAGLVGFPLLTVPDGYIELPLARGGVTIFYEGSGPLVLQTFNTAAGDEIILQQRAVPAEGFAPPAVAYTEIELRSGTTGYLMGREGHYTLAWAENGAVDTAIMGDLSLEQITALAEALAPAGTSYVLPEPGEAATPEPSLFTYPAGSTINLANDLNLFQVVALEIALFYNDLPDGPGYRVMHIANDPAVLEALANALALPVDVLDAPACTPAYELTFRLGNGEWVTFGYDCQPGTGTLTVRASSAGVTLQGPVMITADFLAQLEPVVAQAEARRANNVPPEWQSRIAKSSFTVGPFTVDEWAVLDPGPYAPYTLEFYNILPEEIFAGREALRVSAEMTGAVLNVTAGGRAVSAEVVGDEAGKAFAVISVDGAEAYRIETRIPAGSSPLRGLWEWQGQWVAEVEGHIIIEGVDLVDTLGVEEVFDWQIMDGAPFYFVQAGGVVNARWNDQPLDLGYDEVVHNVCCEAGFFDVGHNENMAWFYARRGDVWSYVELVR